MRKVSKKNENTKKPKNKLPTNANTTKTDKMNTEITPNNDEEKILTEEDCKCMKIIGHLESVKWQLFPRDYRPSPGHLAMSDWTQNPFIWLHYVESSDGILADDDVLLSKNTRYWEIEDVQRYYLGRVHCEDVMFTYQYPYLRMPTPLGSFFWRTCTAYKIQSNMYRSEIHRSLEMTLKKMVVTRAQMDRIIIPDRIVKVERLDYYRRKSFFRLLYDILRYISFHWRHRIIFTQCYLVGLTVYVGFSFVNGLFTSCISVDTDDFCSQRMDHLQLVSFENLSCKRLEGIGLIQRLACFNAETLKYLFLWRFVLPNENPILINYTYITGSGQYIPRPDTKHIFLRSLGELRNLRVLALEYAHIADGTGGALLSLLPVIKRPHFRLQLICREDQIPGCVDAALGVGGYDIPDTAWRRVAIACPDLYLLLAFFRIRDYDNIRRFLTPSIPLREVHLQFGIDLKLRQRQESDISCFIRHIAYRYADTLVTLSIHQWRYVVFPLRRVFELMPRLVRFFYIGMVEDEVDLKRLFQIIACGVCKHLRQVKIQIQDDEAKKTYWRKVVESLTEEFSDIMQLFNIKFCISIYKH